MNNFNLKIQSDDTVVYGSCFLGAAAKLPGLLERISSDLISNRPFKSKILVTSANDPTMDSFRGMQKFAEDFIEDNSTWITKAEYEERGGELSPRCREDTTSSV